MSHSVDLDRLDGTVADLEAFERHLDSELAKLDALVAKLAGSWSGDAFEAYQAAHNTWTEGAARMRASLAQMRAAALTARTNYAAAVAANVAMWRSLE